jgi:hypothetical protein
MVKLKGKIFNKKKKKSKEWGLNKKKNNINFDSRIKFKTNKNLTKEPRKKIRN